MSTPDNFEEKSYARHADFFRDFGAGGAKEAHAKTWFSEGTVDAWRHQRHYDLLEPLLKSEPGARWLTVGDGRYGKDAHYLAKRGCSVLATDISDVLLREAKEKGFIPEFSRENAEALSFGDAEFDYILCKESYHHFPRPMKALYEMLRIAKKGVFLIEPNDPFVSENALTVLGRKARVWLSQFAAKDGGRHAFEVSGNYVFTVSRREMEKVALGLNYRAVAFKGLNDYYTVGVEQEQMAARGSLQRKLKRRIGLRNALCKLGLLDYIVLAVLILKEEPSDALRASLEGDGFEVRNLPRNPYVA